MARRSRTTATGSFAIPALPGASRRRSVTCGHCRNDAGRMSDDAPRMTSHRPYLLRALYQWIADNDMTPHLLVDATRPGVRVPAHVVSEGKVVLNIAARAVGHLDMDNDSVAFTARFGGVSHAVIVPVEAVLAIYARETGQGMALPEEGGLAPAEAGPGTARQDDSGDGNDGSDDPP